MKVTKTHLKIFRTVGVISLVLIVVTAVMIFKDGFLSNPFLYINPPLNIAAWLYIERVYRKQNNS